MINPSHLLEAARVAATAPYFTEISVTPQGFTVGALRMAGGQRFSCTRLVPFDLMAASAGANFLLPEIAYVNAEIARAA